MMMAVFVFVVGKTEKNVYLYGKKKSNEWKKDIHCIDLHAFYSRFQPFYFEFFEKKISKNALATQADYGDENVL